MKKLIGLLGAAGLLIPSAAMAGNIGNQTGSSAMRATGSASSFTHVSVDSNIHRNNHMYVGGYNHGTSIDISAENATLGHRHGHYSYDQTSANAAANIDAEVEGAVGYVGRHSVDGYIAVESERDVTIDEEYTPGQAAEPARCRLFSGCSGAVEATPETTVTTTEGEGAFAGEAGHSSTNLSHAHGGYAEAEGYLNGGYDDSNIEFRGGRGGEHFLNGSVSGSIDHYANGYHGTLTESGDTHTSVDAFTSATAKNKGFESGSFTNTDWN
jgi:hypothetical protein